MSAELERLRAEVERLRAEIAEREEWHPHSAVMPLRLARAEAQVAAVRDVLNEAEAERDPGQTGDNPAWVKVDDLRAALSPAPTDGEGSR